jgi:hypothetical protein
MMQILTMLCYTPSHDGFLLKLYNSVSTSIPEYEAAASHDLQAPL